MTSHPHPHPHQHRVLGIDPGSVSGAYALIVYPDEHVTIDDLPNVSRQIDPAELARIVAHLRPTLAVVEAVNAMPKQGLSSTFRFGVSFGIVMGVLATLRVPTHLTSPQRWKRYHHLDSDKEKSRARALQLYPGLQGLSRKRDAGRAEALLMARYGLETIANIV